MEDTEPYVQRSSKSHTGKLVWDRKVQLAWGFVFYAGGKEPTMTRKQIWEKVLTSGEEVKYEFGVSDKQRNLVLILWAVISLPLFFAAGLGLLTFLVALWIWYVKKAGYAYAFTSKRVLAHTGIFGTKTISVNYDKITDVTVIESFTSKWTQAGNLTINTAGTSQQELVLKNIDRAYEIKKKLDQLRD